MTSVSDDVKLLYTTVLIRDKAKLFSRRPCEMGTNLDKRSCALCYRVRPNQHGFASDDIILLSPLVVLELITAEWRIMPCHLCQRDRVLSLPKSGLQEEQNLTCRVCNNGDRYFKTETSRRLALC